MSLELKAGTILHGTYRIERVLGQGGFGITYLAVDLSLERKVAIKEFFPKDYCDRENATSHITIGTQSAKDFVERLRAKFLKEARNIAKFDHPGIIKIFAAFEENNTAYYVMDFIEGKSLWDIVKQNGPLSEKQALDYMAKAGQALNYVHERRINHLDIKPANIMVRESDNSPILIDFGLSKQYDKKGLQTSTTPTGISHGFAPIEQYNAGGVSEFSPQTDLYSLAATLYFITTGIVPPQATELIDTGLAFPPNFPTRLIGTVTKAMSASRAMRQPTIGAFLSEAGSASDAPSIPSHTPSAPTQPIRPVSNAATQPLHRPAVEKKNSGAKWYVISAVSAAVIVLALFFIFSSKGNDPQSVGSENEEIINVIDMPFTNSLGVSFKFTGTLLSDSIPNGKGIGKYDEGTYTGEYVNGIREGEAEYVTADGQNNFKGYYKDDQYDHGKLMLKDGSYYEGTFENNNFKDGKWYNADGSYNAAIVNGEYNLK